MAEISRRLEASVSVVVPVGRPAHRRAGLLADHRTVLAKE